MKYHISIHISPYEIDNYQTFIHQLRRNLNHVEDKIIFTPMLNLSDYFYDWNNSTLDKTFFIDKFIKINNIVENKCDLKPHVNEDNKILGAFSYKTSFIKRFKNAVDAFIWFDSDMIFPDNTIASLISAHKAVNDKHCIITPQIHRLWDETWDVLVNEKYMTIPASHDNYFGFDGYELYKSTDKDLSVIKNEQRFKFASGWCNLLSSDLFKDYIDFTYDLGHYGPDDTFIMNVLDHYKFNKNKDINQYIIKNLVVTENYKYSLNQYKSYIKLNPSILTKEEFSDGVNRAVSKRLNKIINE
jgi:hypothetical protein|tara:strand:- start:526 stop:1425 length:900 start_codon:yes stop_codon:yes gene_type:complete